LQQDVLGKRKQQQQRTAYPHNLQLRRDLVDELNLEFSNLTRTIEKNLNVSSTMVDIVISGGGLSRAIRWECSQYTDAP